MKRKCVIALGLLCTSVFIGSSMVQAETSFQSNMKLTIEKYNGENGEEPVHPIEPEKPVSPYPGKPGDENPHQPSTKGPLSLNYISNIRFGMNKAGGEDTIFKSMPDRVLDETGTLIEVPNYVQVTDHRGSNAGWTLFVKQEGAFKNGEHELTGTELVFKNPIAVGKSGDSETAPALNAGFTLTADGNSTRVVVANADQGMGTWVSRFGEDVTQATDSITLLVPGKSKKVAGQYHASLTWTLSDVPVND